MTIFKAGKALLLIVSLVLYTLIVAGVVWFAANRDNVSRIGRLEQIIVGNGLWPAGEPPPMERKKNGKSNKARGE